MLINETSSEFMPALMSQNLFVKLRKQKCKHKLSAYKHYMYPFSNVNTYICIGIFVFFLWQEVTPYSFSTNFVCSTPPPFPPLPSFTTGKILDESQDLFVGIQEPDTETNCTLDVIVVSTVTRISGI